MVSWIVNHSKKHLAPLNETAKKYAEAERLLREVIIRHPKTPWADLAQILLTAGCPSSSTSGTTTRNITNANNLCPNTERRHFQKPFPRRRVGTRV